MKMKTDRNNKTDAKGYFAAGLVFPEFHISRSIHGVQLLVPRAEIQYLLRQPLLLKKAFVVYWVGCKAQAQRGTVDRSLNPLMDLQIPSCSKIGRSFRLQSKESRTTFFGERLKTHDGAKAHLANYTRGFQLAMAPDSDPTTGSGTNATPYGCATAKSRIPSAASMYSQT